jgi:hypothetical protein
MSIEDPYDAADGSTAGRTADLGGAKIDPSGGPALLGA